MARIVYSPHYNIGFFGMERLHPFDARKYGRAFAQLRQQFGQELDRMWIKPESPANVASLMAVHTADYLGRLRKPAYVARALELAPVAMLPRVLVDRCVLRPMRWATAGTVIAAREAIAHGLAINLGGGFHHAKPTGGEGFCVYADVGIAVRTLRDEGVLPGNLRIVYIDLDAHQGNGVCHVFRDDRSVFIFDMFNGGIYPVGDDAAQRRIDFPIPITPNCSSEAYMHQVTQHLPVFLDAVSKSKRIDLAIYNAGTDVYEGDPLGMLSVTADAIHERDTFVTSELRRRGIPTAMVLSGGYTRESYKLVVRSVATLLSTG